LFNNGEITYLKKSMMRNLFIANNENSILLDRNKLNRVLFKIKEEITKKKIESKHIISMSINFIWC